MVALSGRGCALEGRLVLGESCVAPMSSVGAALQSPRSANDSELGRCTRHILCETKGVLVRSRKVKTEEVSDCACEQGNGELEFSGKGSQCMVVSTRYPESDPPLNLNWFFLCDGPIVSSFILRN